MCKKCYDSPNEMILLNINAYASVNCMKVYLENNQSKCGLMSVSKYSRFLLSMYKMLQLHLLMWLQHNNAEILREHLKIPKSTCTIS